ncbi:hypothetical protein [Dyadobacter fanqingshengii]|uniref:Lipopolysaccharide biosynthesis protein n=1 Tax=Dyadobacter fanqingshengii TaxID=2906443 RepID=A0A9X1PF35_9BACT|nr:hypothetical protein [Dyadobacter fanqingshengii]MCF0043397.1 hypothetical protein [Dyadobacter fanqingshengii]MCF2504306.1 hypothetical protein [Dyadobacter fanqingshengii]USJ35865.1 hypothetical protein NFI81_24660 [Dyadobacter fanqingshengii]
MSTTTLQPQQQVPEDELTPKEVIEKVLVVKTAILRNWKMLVLLPILGFGIGYGLDTFIDKPNMYEAEVVFNLGGGSQSSGFGDMAGLLGLGNAPDENIFTGENFFYFVKSRPVLERNLMKEVEVNGQKMILANFFIDSSGIKRKEWEEIPENQNFHFANRDIKKLDMKSRRILNELVQKAADATDIASLDRKSSFISLSTSMENGTLAGLWVTKLLETVEEMYTENQTQKSRKTLNLLQHRADSLAAVLGIAEHKLARQLDYSAQILLPEAKVSANSMERKSAFLQTLYYEAMGSAEKMRVTMVREAPLFTEIEGIKVPLDIKAEDKRNAKIGALVGVMLALIFIYFRTVFATPTVVVKQ